MVVSIPKFWGAISFVSGPDTCSEQEMRDTGGHYRMIWYQEVSDLANGNLEFLVSHFTSRCI